MEQRKKNTADLYTNENNVKPEYHYDDFNFTIDPKQESERIDKYLIQKIGRSRVSRNQIQKVIDEQLVTVDGKVVKANFKVKPNQQILAKLPKTTSKKFELIPQNIPLNIIYEDDDLAIVYKKPGMVCHPSVGHYAGTLVNALAYRYKDLPILPGEQMTRTGLVHRIDKDTSGLLVIAKTQQALTHLAKQFFKHSIERTYQALVWGDVKEDYGTIEGHIGRNPRTRQTFTVFPDGEEGKHAVTHYKVIERMYYVTLIECRLETGRTHQIRVHMKHLGHTLFNDYQYGGHNILKGTVFSKYKQFVQNTFDLVPRQALHAKSLGFIHPRTGEKMYFESELPRDMQAAIEKWRNYVKDRSIEEE